MRPTSTSAGEIATDGILDRTWARVVSLAAASIVSATLLLYPYALGTQMTAATHAALPLLLLGVSVAFIHGLGFSFDGRRARLVFGPLVAWPLVALGIVLLVAR